MSPLQSAFEALCDLILNCQSVYTDYIIGAMPAANSLCMQISAGVEENTALDLSGDINLDVVVNAKHTRQAEVFDALADIHHYLPRIKQLPSGQDWQLLSVSTSSMPTFIEKDSDQYMYGSGLEVHLYIK